LLKLLPQADGESTGAQRQQNRSQEACNGCCIKKKKCEKGLEGGKEHEIFYYPSISALAVVVDQTGLDFPEMP
jgi:hypothetical protein